MGVAKLGIGRGIPSREKLQLVNTKWKEKLDVGACTHVFSALERWRQEDQGFKDSCGFMTFEASLGFMRPCFKNKK